MLPFGRRGVGPDLPCPHFQGRVTYTPDMVNSTVLSRSGAGPALLSVAADEGWVSSHACHRWQGVREGGHLSLAHAITWQASRAAAAQTRILPWPCVASRPPTTSHSLPPLPLQICLFPYSTLYLLTTIELQGAGQPCLLPAWGPRPACVSLSLIHQTILLINSVVKGS